MVTTTAPFFIRAVAEGYDNRQNNPAYEEEMAGREHRAIEADLQAYQTSEAVLAELPNALLPELMAMVCESAATTHDMIQLSGIFNPNFSQFAVELASAQKLRSLLSLKQTQLQEIYRRKEVRAGLRNQPGQRWDALLRLDLEDIEDNRQAAQLKTASEAFEARIKYSQAVAKIFEDAKNLSDPQKKLAALKAANQLVDSTFLAGGLSSNQLLRHLFIHSYNRATEQQKQQIIHWAKELRPLLRASFSWWEQVCDRLFAQASTPRMIGFLIGAFLVCCNAYAVYYLVYKLLANSVLSTLAPTLLASAHCPAIIAKIGHLAVGSAAWIIHHKVAQVLIWYGVGLARSIQHVLLPNERLEGVCQIMAKVSSAMPIPAILVHCFAHPFNNLLKRFGIHEFHEQIELMSAGHHEASQALRVWMSLAEYVKKQRQDSAAPPSP